MVTLLHMPGLEVRGGRRTGGVVGSEPGCSSVNADSAARDAGWLICVWGEMKSNVGG